MSVYTTPAEVRLALVPSSDGSIPDPPSNTPADLSDAQLQDAIDEAAAQIDSYIGRYYVTPVAAVGNPGATPHPIDFWCRNIAAYNAMLSFRGTQDLGPEEPISLRWKATMDALNLVATGKVSLSLPTNETDTGTAAVGAAVNPYEGELWTPDDFSLTTGSPIMGWDGLWHDARW